MIFQRLFLVFVSTFSFLCLSQAAVSDLRTVTLGFTSAPEGHGYMLGWSGEPWKQTKNSQGVVIGGRLFVDLYNITVPNLLIQGVTFDKTDYTLLTAGMRFGFGYSKGSMGLLEFGPSFLINDGKLSDDADNGIRIGFGYMVPLHDNAGKGKFKTQNLLIKMDKHFLFQDADNVSGEPDVFNGAYVSLGLSLGY